MIIARLLFCAVPILTSIESRKFNKQLRCIGLPQHELQSPCFLIGHPSKHHHLSARLIVSTLSLLLASTLACASGAQGNNESTLALSDVQSDNNSDDDCNFGPDAWITVKKHHNATLMNLEKKTRQLSMQHPSSIESRIALAKEYRELGEKLINATQYDKAALAYQKATVLLKDIPGENSLYTNSIQERKACYEKKKQRAIFLGRRKLLRKTP